MTLQFIPHWHSKPGYPREEKVTGAHIKVAVNGTGLTNFVRNQDSGSDEPGSAPYLSAYPLATWLAWNWWRLRWEPRYDGAFKNSKWLGAHNMQRAGAGFVWPDITFACDGWRMLVVAKSTPEHPGRPIRYVTDNISLITADSFENGVDEFFDATLSKLREYSIMDTELHECVEELRAERDDEELSKYRRLEAMLGHDPDDGDEQIVSRLIADIENMTESAIHELAALGASNKRIPSIDELRALAKKSGFSSNLADTVTPLGESELPQYGAGPAWERGVAAARALRERERLGSDEPLDDRRLAEMAGVSVQALQHLERASEFAYAIAMEGDERRIVQRSKWSTGRRFDIARLIGDRVAIQGELPLRTATWMSTYRQQLQKAFAAELLAPIEAVDAFLAGQYDEERQQEAADQFMVSPMLINSLLKNNNKIERSEYEALDFLPTAA